MYLAIQAASEEATSWPDALVLLGVMAVFCFIMWLATKD